MLMLPQTYLFVPGNRPDRFDKARQAGADAIILDLEDAVAPHDKSSARAALVAWCAAQTDLRGVVVRINERQSPWFVEDMASLLTVALPRVMLPKTESAEDVAAVRAALPADCRVLPLVETARGMQNIAAIAQAPGVERIVFGTIDYAVDMNLSGDERGLLVPSNQIALASRCAGIGTPVAGVTLALDDEAALLADWDFARALGFGAKLCIHPKQVTPLRTAMRPSATEVDWARRVVQAVANGEGAVQVDGKMVDKPVLRQAQGILARAEKG